MLKISKCNISGNTGKHTCTTRKKKDPQWPWCSPKQKQPSLPRSRRGPTVRSLCDCLLKGNWGSERGWTYPRTQRGTGNRLQASQLPGCTLPSYSSTQMMGTLLYINSHLPQTSLLSVLVFYDWCSNLLLRSRTTKEISKWKNSQWLWLGHRLHLHLTLGPGPQREAGEWWGPGNACVFPAWYTNLIRNPRHTWFQAMLLKTFVGKNQEPHILRSPQLWLPCLWAGPLLFSTQGWPCCRGRSYHGT